MLIYLYFTGTPREINGIEEDVSSGNSANPPVQLVSFSTIDDTNSKHATSPMFELQPGSSAYETVPKELYIKESVRTVSKQDKTSDEGTNLTPEPVSPVSASAHSSEAEDNVPVLRSVDSDDDAIDAVPIGFKKKSGSSSNAGTSPSHLNQSKKPQTSKSPTSNNTSGMFIL